MEIRVSANHVDTADTALSATVLIMEKISDVAINAGQVVRLTSETNCALASYDSYVNALAEGIALNSVGIGEVVRIQVFGLLVNTFPYTLNEQLFLGANGAITNIVPVSPIAAISLKIGKSEGSGTIFIKIGEPIVL
jgi:hypothetical protein